MNWDWVYPGFQPGDSFENKDPELEFLVTKVLHYMKENPVNMKTWAYDLAQSSAQWND